jgi:hypothetical protein
MQSAPDKEQFTHDKAFAAYHSTTNLAHNSLNQELTSTWLHNNL